MRLLLDEHFSPQVARLLRDRGRDVVAVSERRDLRGKADRDQFAAAAAEQRVIVTCDVGDFRPLLHEALQSGSVSFGLVCAPRIGLGRDQFGRLARGLESLLEAHPQVDAAMRHGGELWLQLPDED